MNSKSVIKVQHVEVFEDYWRKHWLLWIKDNAPFIALWILIALTLIIGVWLYLTAPANAQYIRDNASPRLQEVLRGVK